MIVCRQLGNVSSLEKLDLSENGLTDAIADILKLIISKCFHLSHLNLSDNNVANGSLQAIIKGLKGNSSLKKLAMSRTDINAGELLIFARLL